MICDVDNCFPKRGLLIQPGRFAIFGNLARYSGNALKLSVSCFAFMFTSFRESNLPEMVRNCLIAEVFFVLYGAMRSPSSKVQVAPSGSSAMSQVGRGWTCRFAIFRHEGVNLLRPHVLGNR